MIHQKTIFVQDDVVKFNKEIENFLNDPSKKLIGIEYCVNNIQAGQQQVNIPNFIPGGKGGQVQGVQIQLVSLFFAFIVYATEDVKAEVVPEGPTLPKNWDDKN